MCEAVCGLVAMTTLFTKSQFGATDEDLGVLGEVTFELAPGEDASLWEVRSIGNGHGQLVAIGFLDRESVTNYMVQVLARDGGNPAATATANIRVTVLDVNDIRPQLNRDQYNASVTEGTAAGQVIARVRESDNNMMLELT